MSDTKHSTKELKRQYEAAQSRHGETSIALRDAESRYRAKLVETEMAQYADLGIVPGAKVVAVSSNRRGGESRRVWGFSGVYPRSWGGVEVRLSKIKKDGTPAKVATNIQFTRIEPYEGSPEQKAEEKP